MALPQEVMAVIENVDAQLQHRVDSGRRFDSMLKITEFQYRILKEFIYGQEAAAGGGQDIGGVGKGQSEGNTEKV